MSSRIVLNYKMIHYFKKIEKINMITYLFSSLNCYIKFLKRIKKNKIIIIITIIILLKNFYGNNHKWKIEIIIITNDTNSNSSLFDYLY